MTIRSRLIQRGDTIGLPLNPKPDGGFVVEGPRAVHLTPEKLAALLHGGRWVIEYDLFDDGHWTNSATSVGGIESEG